MTRLRSRGDRPGRFHTFPSRVDWVLWASAGDTARMSSSVGTGAASLDTRLVVEQAASSRVKQAIPAFAKLTDMPRIERR